MAEEWGPWVQHDGRGCPVPAGTIVEVVCEDRFGYLKHEIGCTDGDSYSSWDWSLYPELKRILRYRKKKPRGLKMLEDAMQDLDAPQPVKPVDTREKA